MNKTKYIKNYIISHGLRLSLLLLVLLMGTSALAQFPVQVIPSVTPPPPIYWSDYADASKTNGPLRVQLVLNDLSISNREVRLKTYVQGQGLSFQSNDLVVGASPLFLEGGIPLVLGPGELAPYFEFGNITGMAPDTYGQPIPEGSYQFCFEVFDVLSGNRLSDRTCATTVVFQNEPPFLVAPINRSTQTETNPQQLVFQWTPRHINVSQVTYELSIVEIWDNQIDPQAAFLSAPPIFQTTTSNTTYVYGPADPMLLSNKSYAWRVRALAKQGAEDIGLFTNQGYSEIFMFRYSWDCAVPKLVEHEVKGTHQTNISWQDDAFEIPEFTVRYRQKGSGGTWFKSRTTANWLTLWDLRPATAYEYQVAKKCTLDQSDWSPLKSFTTMGSDTEAGLYNCGIPPELSLANKDPLAQLLVNETFTAGDFPVKVLEVSGSQGRFSGKGYVSIPYLNSIKVGVEFTNVLINTERQLAEGTVITTYDPSLKNILSIDDAIDTIDDLTDIVTEPFEGQNDLDEMRVNFPIPPGEEGDFIKMVDGNVVITNPANGVSISEPLGDDKVVVDSNGQTYHIDAAGNISQGGMIDAGGAVTTANVEGVGPKGQLERLTAQGITVDFDAIDVLPKGATQALREDYGIILDQAGNEMVLKHHAVKNQGTAKLKVRVNMGTSGIPLDSLRFKTQQGELIPFDVNTTTLNLKGRYSHEYQTIYAVVPGPEGGKQRTAGAFVLWHLSPRPVEVVLVSVNGGNLTQAANTVSDIYEKALAQVNVSTKTISDWDQASLGPDGRFEVGDSPWLSAYNQEQKAIINDLKGRIDYRENAYYVFVFNKTTPTKAISGFMPLEKQFGFVFAKSLGQGDENKGNDLGTTIAHELGHGVFALQHPFDKWVAKAQSDLLMDYTGGTHLNHRDWAQIHNPALKFYLFQDEEDGELGGKIWFTPDWRPITIPYTSIISSTTSSRRVKGTLPGFKLSNSHYIAHFDPQGNFVNYFNVSDKDKTDPYSIPLASELDLNEPVYLYEYVENDCDITYETSYSYVEKNKGTIAFTNENSNIKKVEIVKCEPEDEEPVPKPFITSICSLIDAKDTYPKSYLDRTVNALNKAYTKVKDIDVSSPTRKKGEFRFLANLDQSFLNDRAEIIEDKLYLLKQKTGINFIVTFINGSERLSKTALNKLAIDVLKAKENTIPKSEKTVLVVAPYLKIKSGISNINCLQFGFGQSAHDIITQPYLELLDEGNLFNYLIGLFSGIEKPVSVHYSFLLANKTVHIESRTSTTWKRGQPFINGLSIVKSKHYDTLRSLEKEIVSIKNSKPDDEAPFSERYKYQTLLTEKISTYDTVVFNAEQEDIAALLAIVNDGTNLNEHFIPVLGERGIFFREPYVTDESMRNGLMVSYTKMHQGYEEHNDFIVGVSYFLGDSSISQIENEHLYEEINYKDPIYAILDVTSLILAPTGLDFAPEAIGMIFATTQGDYFEAGMYAVSVGAVGITSYAAYAARKGNRYILIKETAIDGEVVALHIKQKKIPLTENETVVRHTSSSNLEKAKKQIKEESGLDFNDGNTIYLKSDAEDLVKKWKRIESLVDISFDEFKNSVNWGDNISEQIKVNAYEMWAEKEYKALYKLFVDHNINAYNGVHWPPAYGVVPNTRELINAPQLSELDRVFDRFQMDEALSGSFASPVMGTENHEQLLFTYNSRAMDEFGYPKEGSFYIKFELDGVLPDDLIFEKGQVMPWFNKQNGLGDQIRLVNKQISFEDLLKSGSIKIKQKLRKQNGQWHNMLKTDIRIENLINDLKKKMDFTDCK